MSVEAFQATSPHHVVLEPNRSGANYWRDLWRYRELFLILAWRDVAVRYKQTFFGVAWAVVRPVLTIAIFTILFDKVAELPSNGIPYALMVAVGQLPWQFFAGALTQTSNSLIGNQQLLSKVYIPRLTLPAASVSVTLVDFVISVVFVLIPLMAYHIFFEGATSLIPTWRILFVIPMSLLLMASALAFGVWFAALNVAYRDVRQIVPFIVQFGLFVSPVGYATAVVVEKFGNNLPAGWEWLVGLLWLNPMFGIIDGFRWAVLGMEMNWLGFSFSVFMTVVLLYFGIRYFRKLERTFADLV